MCSAIVMACSGTGVGVMPPRSLPMTLFCRPVMNDVVDSLVHDALLYTRSNTAPSDASRSSVGVRVDLDDQRTEPQRHCARLMVGRLGVDSRHQGLVVSDV